MAPRTIYLISYRQAPSQRAHFAIFVPSATDPEKGSVIHAVGAPMAGYSHEFKRGYNPTLTRRRYEMWPIGEVDSSHIVDWPDDIRAIHTDPKGDIEIAASQVPAPGISENFMALLIRHRLRTEDVKSGPWNMSVIWSRKGTLEHRRLRSSNLNVILPLMELVYGR